MRFHFSDRFHRRAARFAAAAAALMLLSPAAMPAGAIPLRAAAATVAAVDINPLTPPIPEPMGAIALTIEELSAARQTAEAAELEYIPHVWPVHFSEIGSITSCFGYRTNPTAGVGTEFHGGVDLADRPGSKIYASASGTVVEAGDNGGYGLTILVDHGNGYKTRYCHCSSLLVSEGDSVSQGEIIATMGRTGRVTGVHLDFRVYIDDTPVDPLEILDPLSD